MAVVLEELPVVGPDLVKRVERWDPEQDHGPAGAADFAAGRGSDDVLTGAMQFWQDKPEGLEARAAWLGPVRRDYRMRYRLDLVRDFDDGRREAFVVIRTGPEAFTTYRTLGQAPREVVVGVLDLRVHHVLRPALEPVLAHHHGPPLARLQVRPLHGPDPHGERLRHGAHFPAHPLRQGIG